MFSFLQLLALQALCQEAALTPKPGLVDSNNNGSHTDMDLPLFYQSARAIAPFMPRFAESGYAHSHLPTSQILSVIRPLGIECEKVMFDATENINTHKGAIFTLGLLCTAIGYTHDSTSTRSVSTLCETVALFCKGLVENELKKESTFKTAGYMAYQKYGITGARGEAESGLASIRTIGLPMYKKQVQENDPPELAQLQTLMHYIAQNKDTNLISRGGIEGLTFAQQLAQTYLDEGGVFADQGLHKLREMDQQFIEKRLSPGGSADFLAMTLFLYDLETNQHFTSRAA